jgi:hypothetical protein
MLACSSASLTAGFAAYWLRDEARSTPYPTPIDLMIKASALAMKSHESIPGIWLQVRHVVSSTSLVADQQQACLLSLLLLTAALRLLLLT